MNKKLIENRNKHIGPNFSLHYNSKKKVDSSLEDQNNNRTEIDLPSYSLTNIVFIKNLKRKVINIFIKIGIGLLYQNI